MAVLTFPNSPTDGQTVVINDSTYIYREDITAWELLFNAPPLHAPSHELGGGDPLTLDQSQITGLTDSIVGLSQYASSSSILQNIPVNNLEAEKILRTAVWWVDANHSSSNSQEIHNLGWGGPAFNVRSGASTSEGDASDPRYLDFTGQSYVYLPGNNSDYLSVSDDDSLDITEDIDLRVKVALDQWTSGSTQRIFAKHGALGNRSWLVSLLSNQTIQFIWYEGSTQNIVTSTAAINYPDKNDLWLRVTLDVDNGASGHDVTFYTSYDGASWSQLGTTVTNAGATSIFSSTAPIEIGDCSALSGPAAGKYYRAVICGGLNGIPVLDIDTDVITSSNISSFMTATGHSVTINKSSSGAKRSTPVVSPCFLLGGDDYMEVRSKWQEHSGTNFAYIPGVDGNYLSVPHSAPFDITGNIDIRARVALEDWTPGVENTLISKAGSAGQISWYLSVLTNGSLRFAWSVDGTNVITKDSTTPIPLSDGEFKWVRVTLDTDNGASQNEVRFYTGDDGINWSPLGVAVITGGVTSIYSSTAPIELGAKASGTFPMTGKIYRAVVYENIDGTIRLNVDIDSDVGDEESNPSSFTASTGGTVTVNRSGDDLRTAIFTKSGYPVVGSDELAISSYSALDFSSSDSFTIVAVSQQDSYSADQVILAKRVGTPSGASGYALTNGSAATDAIASVSDGTTLQDLSVSGRTAGFVDVFGIVRDVSSDNYTTFYNGTLSTAVTDTTTADISNIHALRIGRYSSTGANNSDMRFFAAAIFRKALTESEINTVSTYFRSRIRS